MKTKKTSTRRLKVSHNGLTFRRYAEYRGSPTTSPEWAAREQRQRVPEGREDWGFAERPGAGARTQWKPMIAYGRDWRSVGLARRA